MNDEELNGAIKAAVFNHTSIDKDSDGTPIGVSLDDANLLQAVYQAFEDAGWRKP